MRKMLTIISVILIISSSFGQGNEVRKNREITVVFENEDPSLNPEIIEGLTDIILDVYPKLMNDFNPEAITNLRVKIDTAYNGVAYAHKGKITINSEWLHQKPHDLDLITHEVMHIIQSYPSRSGPSWLTEGIADYVRYKYGVDNIGAGWSLPSYAPTQNYTNSYRITARFLLWIKEKYDEDLIVKLDRSLRNKTYSKKKWIQLTGKSLDELWIEYSENPEIS